MPSTPASGTALNGRTLLAPYFLGGGVLASAVVEIKKLAASAAAANAVVKTVFLFI